MTAFSFEVPTPHLKDFHPYQDFYFTLSILYNDLQYAEHIRRVQQLGLHSVWLDNSFNETFTSDSPDDLIAIANQTKPRFIVIPDDPTWGLSRMADSCYEMYNYVEFHRMVIPCATFKMHQYFEDFAPTAKKAISYHIRDNWKPEELSAVSRDTHYLGLNSVEELCTYNPASCDTSMPIKLAMQDKTMAQWEDEGCPHIHTKDLGHHGSDFFNATLTPKTITLAIHNVRYLKHKVNKERI